MAKIDYRENLNADWEQRRYEVAKAVLPQCIMTAQEVLAHGGRLPYNSLAETCASNAVSYADELIKQLKGGSE